MLIFEAITATTFCKKALTDKFRWLFVEKAVENFFSNCKKEYFRIYGKFESEHLLARVLSCLLLSFFQAFE